MEWIFIRHGETEDNIEKVFAGWTDSKLSKKGKRQVKAVANKLHEELQGKDQIRIYSSPLHRTKVLAQAVEERLNQDRETKKVQSSYMEDLKEVHFGIFEGLNQRDIVKRYPREWQLLMENYGNYSIPEGETLEAFHQRVINVLDKIQAEGNEEVTRLIITHGGVVQSALVHLLDLSMESRWHFSIPNTGIVKIEVVQGFGILKSICPPME